MAIIASRTLSSSDGSTTELHIFAPIQVSDQEWACQFQLGEHAQQAFGLDGLQALLMAIEGLRAQLGGMPPMTWIGGELGDCGVPRMVPQAFGLAFSRRIDELIDEELSDLGR